MIAPVALLISFALPVFAAHVSQWGNVQSLRPGDRVGIIQSDQKRVEGNFHNATEEGITIKTDQEITVAKTNVIACTAALAYPVQSAPCSVRLSA